MSVRKAKEAYDDLGAAMEEGAGTEFLSRLKNFFLSLSNCDLDNISLDKDGLEALGDVLVQAGFDPAAVEEFISDLTVTLEELDTTTLAVSEFMDDLFDLPLAEDEDITQADLLMATSDLPYIQSLLSMMGVDEEKISAIMDEVSEGPRGFDFEAFVEQLGALFDAAQETGTSYQTNSGEDAYKTLLEQLGLDSFVESGDSLTLNQLVSAFEQKLHQQEADLPVLTDDDPPSFFSELLVNGSDRETLLSQLLSGIQIQDDGEEITTASAVLTAGSDAVTQEIQDRFISGFLNQVKIPDATGQATDSEDGLNPATLSTKSSSQEQAVADTQVKIASFDVGVEKVESSGTSQQSGTGSSSDSQTLILGVEKSTTTIGVSTTGAQKAHQALSTLPDFVTRQVGKSIVRAVNTGDDTIRMQLKPPELGRVYMSIDHNGNSMKVSVITEHQSAKDILTANVNEIKTMLSSSGISLESFEVDMSSDFKQSMADARTQDQSLKKRQTRGGAGSESQNDNSDNLTVQSVDMYDSGSLHFVA